MKYLLLSFFLLVPSTLFAQKLTITFISNEGFLFESGEHKVLIDALHDQSHFDHTYPSDETIKQMISGSGLFADIDVYLLSHVHNTHFRPAIVGAFLSHNPISKMIALPQLRDSLKQEYEDYNAIKDQLSAYDWSQASISYTLNKVDVTAFKITHIGEQWSWVQNLAHIVSVGSKKILHLGDLEWDEETLLSINLNTLGIDVVIIPHWLVFSTQQVQRIKQVINAKHYIVSHITISNKEGIERRIRNLFPDALILNEALKQHTIP